MIFRLFAGLVTVGVIAVTSPEWRGPARPVPASTVVTATDLRDDLSAAALLAGGIGRAALAAPGPTGLPGSMMGSLVADALDRGHRMGRPDGSEPAREPPRGLDTLSADDRRPAWRGVPSRS